MKKILPAAIALIFTLNAQLININPDPNGDPWLAGGWKIPDPEEMQRIEDIPKLILPEKYKGNALPYKLDNSTLPYFRPIFNQMGGSCAQAAGVAYNFTYEMNSLNGTDASLSDNQFPTHYTYNFLNGGSGDNGSTYFSGWDIINAGGVPNVTTYGGLWPSTSSDTMHKLWMKEFTKYTSGMGNRIVEVLTIPVGTPEGLQTLKQYFNDYCDGSVNGGIVNFAAGVSWVEIDPLPAGTEEEGKSILWKWDAAVNHAMTFVGYNDSIRFDLNGDGRFTNDLDINGDGVVDMKDWEKGGLLMANSWGSGWVNGGKIWVAYRTLALELEEGGIWTNSVHTIRIRDDFRPSLYLKTSVNFSERNELKIYAGVSTDTTAIEPEHIFQFPHFNRQGGTYGMSGDSNILEFGLDISPLLSYIVPGEKAKFFLCVEHKDDGAAGRGNVEYFSIIDDLGNEYQSPDSSITIARNSTTFLSTEASFNFDPPNISDCYLPEATPGKPYEYILNAAGGASPYRWDTIIAYEEIENTGSFTLNTPTQLIMTNEDDGYAVIDLPFSFPFYGKLYNSVTVITDGSIKLEEGFDYIRSEGDILAFKTITAFGADLMSYPEDGDGVYYYLDSESLTVRWITSLYDVRDVNVDFQIKIYPDSRIEFFYGDYMTTGLSWAAGISNGKAADAKISYLSNSSDPSGLKTAFSTDPYPYGLELSTDGIFSGSTPVADTSWNITFRVTDDRNISSIKNLTFITLAGIGDETAGDKTFGLMQNYPNPFNPSTKINFYLKNTSNVNLKLFNSAGQLVRELIDRKLDAGNHGFLLNAEGLNSGVYYYTLKADDKSLTKKMLLIK
jgi:hypothetical protein